MQQPIVQASSFPADAPSSAGKAVFKIHLGRLEIHSDVFNRLSSMPQPRGHAVEYRLPDDLSDVTSSISFVTACGSSPVFQG